MDNLTQGLRIFVPQPVEDHNRYVEPHQATLDHVYENDKHETVWVYECDCGYLGEVVEHTLIHWVASFGLAPPKPGDEEPTRVKRFLFLFGENEVDLQMWVQAHHRDEAVALVRDYLGGGGHPPYSTARMDIAVSRDDYPIERVSLSLQGWQVADRHIRGVYRLLNPDDALWEDADWNTWATRTDAK